MYSTACLNSQEPIGFGTASLGTVLTYFAGRPGPAEGRLHEAAAARAHCAGAQSAGCGPERMATDEAGGGALSPPTPSQLASKRRAGMQGVKNPREPGNSPR
jgi:hypothetical protein